MFLFVFVNTYSKLYTFNNLEHTALTQKKSINYNTYNSISLAIWFVNPMYFDEDEKPTCKDSPVCRFLKNAGQVNMLLTYYGTLCP